MRFQVMEQRISCIEQSPPSVKRASLVDPKATRQSPSFSPVLQQVPEVTTRIFLAPVLTESEKQTDHSLEEKQQVALVSRNPGAPFYRLSHTSIMSVTVNGFTTKTVTQAVTRIANTYYGSPKHPSPEIPLHLDVPDKVQSRYSFNLPQILTYVYTHKVDQDTDTAAELRLTGHKRIGSLGKSQELSIGCRTKNDQKSRKSHLWKRNLVGNALEQVRNHLYQGQLGTLLRPLDHSCQIQPWVATLATQTHDGYEPPHNATRETAVESKHHEKGAVPKQALDAH